MQRVWRAHEQWSTPFALCTLHFALCTLQAEEREGGGRGADVGCELGALGAASAHSRTRPRRVQEQVDPAHRRERAGPSLPLHTPHTTHHTLHSHWFLYFSTASSFTLFSFFLPHSYAAKFDALSATRSTSCVFFIYFRLHLFFFLFPSFTSLPLWKLNMWRMISNV